MGNRANVIFQAGERISPNVYVHWNGGPESVYAFIAELDRQGVRADADYECARFVAILARFFEDGYSLGLTSTPPIRGHVTAEDLEKVYTDAGDNGFYVIDRTQTPTKARRFLSTFDPKSGRLSLEEMPPIAAQTERARALEDPKYAALSEHLAEMWAGVPT